MTLTEEAQAFHAKHPTLSSSAFACRYPGQYREAAQALRQVRQIDEPAITDYCTTPNQEAE